MTAVNTRTLDVKATVKASLVNCGAKYKKMYSNVLKSGDLRLKYYDLKAVDSVANVVAVLEALNVGTVEKLATGKFGLVKKPTWSVVVHVDADLVK